MVRDRTERPSAGVRSQCAALGGEGSRNELVEIGSKGLISGARIATATKNSTTKAPTMAPRRLTRRRKARRQGGDSGAAMAVVSGETAVMASSSRSGAQARVDEEISEVGEQVQEDIRRRGEQDDALDHGVVAVEHGIDDELAEAGNGEDLLGQHGTREELAEF